MKKLLLIGVIALTATGCGTSRHHLSDESEVIVDTFDQAATSYHAEMGHNPLEELGHDCEFSKDYRKQLDALEGRLERIDQSRFCPTSQRLRVLGEAVAHIGRTARWDTGLRGSLYAGLKFKTDAGWRIHFRKLCKAYGEKP